MLITYHRFSIRQTGVRGPDMCSDSMGRSRSNYAELRGTNRKTTLSTI